MKGESSTTYSTTQEEEEEVSNSNNNDKRSGTGLGHGRLQQPFFEVKNCRSSRGSSLNSKFQQQEVLVYRGVRHKSELNKWVTEIPPTAHKRNIWLGTYKSLEEVARAYDVGIHYTGKKIPFNFPEVAKVASHKRLRRGARFPGRWEGGISTHPASPQVGKLSISSLFPGTPPPPPPPPPESAFSKSAFHPESRVSDWNRGPTRGTPAADWSLNLHIMYDFPT
ncbi:hypothetical protein CY35_08G117000 [Sphagnum magellanicum]|nr:hypothetical protein CY35_08G117000 [Sphagnum magellanicum]